MREFTDYPHSDEAEKAVLGSCLLSPDALVTTMELLKPEDFYQPMNAELFKVISGMYSAGNPVNMLTVCEELKAHSLYEPIGGMAVIANMMSSVHTTAAISSHAEIVRDYALRRRMIIAGDKIAQIAQKPEYDSSEIIAEAEKEILKASQNMESSSPVSVGELSPSLLSKIDDIRSSGGRKITGYSSGFKDLDKILSGFQPGSLNIIAARPSMGKTALALNIAQFGRVEDSCVLLFSLGMSAEQLMHRMYSAESGVSLASIMEGRMTDEDYYSLTEAAKNLSKRKIYINDSSELSAMEFRTKCRRFKTCHPELALTEL